jgi:hypothetical protein
MSDEKEETAEQSSITNTTKQMMEAPILGLALGMMDRDSGRRPGAFIEDMEARGQKEMVAQTTQLPTKGSDHFAWNAMGVKFGEKVAGDDIWRKVTLPSGWKLNPTEHAMWSHLTDERGRVRGKVFYKAAFYDRSCHIYPETRYGRKSEYKDDNYDSARREVVYDKADNDKVLFATEYVEPLPRGADEPTRRAFYEAQDARGKMCSDFLLKTFPDHENAAAYWD